MQIVDWTAADEATRQALLRRPAQAAHKYIRREAADIIAAVRAQGDAALRDFALRFDGASVAELQVPPQDGEAALADLDPEIRRALDTAITSLRRYHSAGMQQDYSVETAAGVECRRLIRPLDTVGLYVPGGSSPLASTVLMLAVPARLAGCRRIVLCTPPRRDGVEPLILAAAALCGVDTVIAAGGAQAIAAMAYGTASVPRVDKILGPGNAWVTAAKLVVSADAEGVPCDLPAGPSEVLVIADAGAEPGFVAADLLSQAEHGADSQVLLVTDSREMAVKVCAEIKVQLTGLPRARIARGALTASRVLVTRDLDEAVTVSNAYAPEHLILAVRRPEALLEKVSNAGSVFLGDWTPEALGDYVSGTNHVLPTYGFARSLSGLAVQDFQKRIAVQRATPSGLAALGPAAVTLAQAESLEAHARAVSLRLAALEQEARRVQRA
jgi:histidinol dehydrogenase